jgi:hypothetical protein
MRAGARIDELGVDADPVLVALDRALQHIAHAELPPDVSGVDVLALKLKAVLRAITKLLWIRDRSVVRFSVMPSAK